MTQDGGLPFLSALAAFRFRVLYANVCNDFLVKMETASIAGTFHPRLLRLPPIAPQYPHIVFDTRQHVTEWPPVKWREDKEGQNEGRFFEGDDRAPLLATMLRTLSGLGWRRVAARFERTVDGTRPLPFPLQFTNAHNKLPVVRPLLDGAGSDSVEHLCSVWAQHAAELFLQDGAEGPRASERASKAADQKAAVVAGRRGWRERWRGGEREGMALSAQSAGG